MKKTSGIKTLYILTITDYDDTTRYIMCAEKAEEIQEMLETRQLDDEIDYSFEEIDFVDDSILKNKFFTEDIDISYIFVD